MRIEIVNTIFGLLEGTWSGGGRGIFPTIDNFEYKETSTIVRDEERLLLHFEQRTWVMPTTVHSARPSHWESGFLIFDETNHGTLNCAQSGGRLELLKVDKLVEK